jgi:hypothetical protein
LCVSLTEGHKKEYKVVEINATVKIYQVWTVADFSESKKPSLQRVDSATKRPLQGRT